MYVLTEIENITSLTLFKPGEIIFQGMKLRFLSLPRRNKMHLGSSNPHLRLSLSP